MKYYAVMQLLTKFASNPDVASFNLQKGQFYIPVFEDRKQADDFSEGKFTIITLESENSECQQKTN